MSINVKFLTLMKYCILWKWKTKSSFESLLSLKKPYYDIQCLVYIWLDTLWGDRSAQHLVSEKLVVVPRIEIIPITQNERTNRTCSKRFWQKGYKEPNLYCSSKVIYYVYELLQLILLQKYKISFRPPRKSWWSWTHGCLEVDCFPDGQRL